MKGYAKDTAVAYLFLAPVIVGIALFTAYPIVMSLFYSFSDFNGSYATVINFDNYIALFDGSSGEFFGFMRSLGITALYVVCSTALNLVLSYALALFLRRQVKGIRAIRLLCYLPCLVPAMASGLIWKDAFAYNAMGIASEYGIFNSWLYALGLEPFPFFEAASTSMFSLILTNLWTVGGGMIMWIAALENVPPELYESAELEGAGYFTRVFSITIPLTTNMLFYNLLTSLINGLQIFTTFAVYGTGTDESLYFVAIRIYTAAFPGNMGVPNYGLACAMAWVLFLIIAALTAVMFKTSKWVTYGDE